MTEAEKQAVLHIIRQSEAAGWRAESHAASAVAVVEDSPVASAIMLVASEIAALNATLLSDPVIRNQIDDPHAEPVSEFEPKH